MRFVPKSVVTLFSAEGRTTQDKHSGNLPGSHPSGSTPSPRQPSPANQVHTGFPSSDSPTFCSFDQYTYEKTIGYNLRFAPRDRIPTRATVGVVSDAYAECQRLGDRCRSFVVEYGDFQVASWLPLAAEDNRNALSVQTNAAYFEKVCFLGKRSRFRCYTYTTFDPKWSRGRDPIEQ